MADDVEYKVRIFHLISKNVSASSTLKFSKDNDQLTRPKATIVEGVKPFTKLVTVSSQGNSVIVSDKSFDCNDQPLHNSNPIMLNYTTKINGNSRDDFNSTPKTDVSSKKMIPPRTNTKPSRLSSFFGRLSYNRHKKKCDTSRLEESKDETKIHKSTDQITPRKSHKIKRWLSKRIFGQKHPESYPPSGTSSTNHSLASSDAILDIPSTSNDNSRTVGCNSVPLVRKASQNLASSSNDLCEDPYHNDFKPNYKTTVDPNLCRSGTFEANAASSNRQSSIPVDQYITHSLSSGRVVNGLSRKASRSEASMTVALLRRMAEENGQSPEPRGADQQRLHHKSISSLRSTYTPSYSSLSRSAVFTYPNFDFFSRSSTNIDDSKTKEQSNCEQKQKPGANGDVNRSPEAVQLKSVHSNPPSGDQHKDESGVVIKVSIDHEVDYHQPASSSSPLKSGDDLDSTPVRLRRNRTRSGTQSTSLRTTTTTTNNSDADHFRRSSLIMLAVSHASPRTRPVTPVTQHAALEGDDSLTSSSPLPPPITPLIDHHQSTTESPFNTPSSPHYHHHQTSGRLQPVDESPPQSHPSSSVSTTPPVHDRDNDISKCNVTTDSQREEPLTGAHFLHLADQSEANLVIKIDLAESDLKSSVDLMSDEVAGNLRTAIGQARLLIAEKFAQFRTLCHQNLASGDGVDRSSTTVAGTNNNNTCEDDGDHQLVTLVSDLDGFWAMVSLQIDAVQRQFDTIDKLRQVNWIKVEKAPSKPIKSGRKPKATSTITTNRRKPVDDEAARLKARQRLLTIKKQLQAKAQQDQPDSTKIESESTTTANGHFISL